MVIAIIAILAAMLLPALSRAKAQAQSTVCKNHLHQMGLALKMYVDDARKYPLETYWTNNQGAASHWVNLLSAYYPVAWTNPAYHCPAYKGYIAAPDTAGTHLGSYGYNAEGTWQFGAWPDPNLGLGGLSEPDHRSSVISEAQVLVPTDMIEFGEPLVQLANVYATNRTLLWSSFAYLQPGAASFYGPVYKYPLRHGKNCNVVLCDGHVESTAPSNLFNMTNSAIRWNNDHQSHPETWKWY